jgi:hypothetical protein
MHCTTYIGCLLYTTWRGKGKRVDLVLTCIGVGNSITIYLVLEIHAHHGRWKDYFLSPLFIRISKHTRRLWKYLHAYIWVFMLPSIYFSRFMLTVVDGNIPFSLFFLFKSQSRRKYKSIFLREDIFFLYSTCPPDINSLINDFFM